MRQELAVLLASQVRRPHLGMETVSQPELAIDWQEEDQESSVASCCQDLLASILEVKMSVEAA